MIGEKDSLAWMLLKGEVRVSALVAVAVVI